MSRQKNEATNLSDSTARPFSDVARPGADLSVSGASPAEVFHAGERLRALREAAGLTQRQVAEALGLSGGTSLSRIERSSAALRVPFARAAADFFGVAVDELLPGLSNVSITPEAAAPGRQTVAHGAAYEIGAEGEGVALHLPPLPAMGERVRVTMQGDAMEPEIADGEEVEVECYAAPLPAPPADGVYLVAVGEGMPSQRPHVQIVRVQALRGGIVRLCPSNPLYEPTVLNLADEPHALSVLGRVRARDRVAAALIRQFLARYGPAAPHSGPA